MSKKIFHNNHYTTAELLYQVNNLKKAFSSVISKPIKRGIIEVIIKLTPTEYSKEYTIKIVAKTNSTIVDVFVIKPKVEMIEQGKIVPHLYSNGSLCLFYPSYNEWNYNDLWSETLVPWTSLWLFYYEIWQETGSWEGGGIHRKKMIPFRI